MNIRHVDTTLQRRKINILVRSSSKTQAMHIFLFQGVGSPQIHLLLIEKRNTPKIMTSALQKYKIL